LVVLAGSLTVAGAAIWLSPATAGQCAGWDAVLGLFALASTAGVERSEFRFDQSTKTVSWSRRTVFRRLTGTFRFGDVTGIGFERSWTSSRPSNARRLIIFTTRGPVPLTNAYSGILGAANAVGAEISSYLSVPFDRLPG